MKVKITEIENTVIEGVRVHFEDRGSRHEEKYFVWKESPLEAHFASADVSGGIIDSWHHSLTFGEVEYHEDEEMFYFTAGTAVMLFADIEDGGVNMESVQAVRVPQGTQMIIGKGKGHFVAIAEGDQPVKMVVVAPKMEAPRVALEEEVTAV